MGMRSPRKDLDLEINGTNRKIIRADSIVVPRDHGI